jgi:2-dehydro-3-deoxyphosphogluconate aldolase/(4S)-4-hydroxy-2-oxoglutarate aldolase
MALGDSARRLDPLELVGHGPVIPVIVIERAEDAVPMARALLAGGVRVLEVTLRTPAALAAIAAIAQSIPDVIVGRHRAERRRRAPRSPLGRASRSAGLFGAGRGGVPRIGLALLPGVATASEVMLAAEEGRFLASRRRRRRTAMLKAWASVCRCVVLPDRRHLPPPRRSTTWRSPMSRSSAARG